MGNSYHYDYQYGNSQMDLYLAGLCVGIMLSGNGFGRGIRCVIRIVGVSLLESFVIKPRKM